MSCDCIYAIDELTRRTATVGPTSSRRRVHPLINKSTWKDNYFSYNLFLVSWIGFPVYWCNSLVTLEIHTPFFINAFNCNLTVELRNYLQLKLSIQNIQSKWNLNPMSTIWWGIDHYDKITLSCASLIELCTIRPSLNLLVLNTSLNFRYLREL